MKLGYKVTDTRRVNIYNMNRREFLRRSAFSALAVAVTGIPLSVQGEGKPAKLTVKETHFKFSEPLVRRSRTDAIVIHHVGGTDQEIPASKIHEWHLANKWAGIGYHYVIHKDGTVERGRPMNSVGAHCCDHNHNTVGICFVGDYERAVPTGAALSSGVLLMAYICKTYGIKPGPETILGHKDLNDTLCPGKNMYAKLGAFRKTVARYC